jgi:hypothetical protein
LSHTSSRHGIGRSTDEEALTRGSETEEDREAGARRRRDAKDGGLSIERVEILR